MVCSHLLHAPWWSSFVIPVNHTNLTQSWSQTVLRMRRPLLTINHEISWIPLVQLCQWSPHHADQIHTQFVWYNSPLYGWKKKCKMKIISTHLYMSLLFCVLAIFVKVLQTFSSRLPGKMHHLQENIRLAWKSSYNLGVDTYQQLGHRTAGRENKRMQTQVNSTVKYNMW